MNITDDYYDFETYHLLCNTLNNDDAEYINYSNETLENLMFNRWKLIINSLPANYSNQYSSQPTSADRNAWLKKYLDYPTKNISEMPEFL
jgi:hypothetical protein